MRLLTPLIFLSLFNFQVGLTEGTHEAAPNGSITVNGNATTDIAALHINHVDYNNFASYTNPDPHSRLYIHIINPATECVYVGFSFGHPNVTTPDPPPLTYEYRIKDPNGNVVFGPVTVSPGTQNIFNWSQAFSGPMQLFGPSGYNAIGIASSDLTSQGWSGEGDYYIEFQDETFSDFLIDFWDITVADCSTASAKKGRIWSYNWSFFAINDFGFPERPFNGAFYVCAPDPDDADKAFVTKIDFNGAGFRPAAFNIAFNSFGSQNTGDVSEDRKSIPGINSTQSEYAIFLNDPVEICKTAILGEITLMGISRCTADDFCIRFTTTKVGQIDVLLDFNGPDSLYTPGTADVLITHNVSKSEVGVPSCIDWNGRDGFGNPVIEIAGTLIPVIVSYAQGIYHFPIYDAEFMTQGFMIQAVRPPASIPLLHYDDSNIPVASGSGEPKVQLSGCVNPCHRWTNFNAVTNVGYGNVNTINSWWFSQRILRQDVFLLPAFYTCSIEGPVSLCQGGTAQLNSNPIISPSGAEGPEIISTLWTGPDIIGSNSGSSITIGSDGTYAAEVKWLSGAGDTCQSSCEFSLTLDPPSAASIDTLLLYGDTLEINGEEYTEAGEYIQHLEAANGCDSVLTITIKVLQTVILYNLNDCLSNNFNGNDMIYTEFTPLYPQPLSCAAVTGTILFRDPPQGNKHSCTPGVNNSIAMCVSSLDDCTYDAGNQRSVVFEITIVPAPDTAVHLTGLTFFEQAPVNYNWIGGDSGLNNFPTLFGLRILKNGIEIYRDEAIPTNNTWTEKTFDFFNNTLFVVKDPTVFRFELLPYCLIGNGSAVAAWDMDEVNVRASCTPFIFTPIIEGDVKTEPGRRVKNVEIQRSGDPSFQTIEVTQTDQFGQYAFKHNESGRNYYLRSYKNTEFRNGVSTLDLIQIKKHILGKKALESPYQFIAADVNRNNSISVLDLVELRKLLLAIYSEFLHNTSWRFGTAHPEWEGTYPWGFKETIEIEALNKDVKDANFIAVKIGDVNGDAKTNLQSNEIFTRSGSILQLQIKNIPLIAGIETRFDITSDNFKDIAGFQFALDISGFRMEKIIDGKLNVADENFSISSDGVLRISWDNVQPVSAESNEVLFSILMTPYVSGQLSDMLQMNLSALEAEAYTGEELERSNLELEFLSPENSGKENILFQNEPNPFSSNTTIRFQLSESCQASIRLFDLSGRVLKEITGYFEQGMNSVEVSNTDLGLQEGMVICQLQCNGFVAIQKMVLIK